MRPGVWFTNVVYLLQKGLLATTSRTGRAENMKVVHNAMP